MHDVAGTICDRAIVRRALDELRAGRPVVLASLLATRGSMPRAAGARMLATADGGWLGTVGGGNIELIAQRRCRELLSAASSAAEKDREVAASLEWMTHEKNAMACGGDALLAVRLLGRRDVAALEGLAALLGTSGGEVVVGPGAEPCAAAARDEAAWLVEDWSDPWAPAMRLVRDAGELTAAEAGCDVSSWDADCARYVEPVGAEPVCYVFGGGHVGRALVPVLASVGFRVVVYDDRPAVADPAAFPRAERVVCGEFADLLDHVSPGARDYVVVLTHGHLGDACVLERVLPRRPAYVGCIGSRRKAGFVRQSLLDAGAPAEAVDAVRLPIGEDILAVTPAEIAVSIAAQLIRCRAELRPTRPHQASAAAFVPATTERNVS